MKRRPRAWFCHGFLLALTAAGFAGCSVPVDPALVIADCDLAGGICVPEGHCATSGGTVPGTSNCHSDDGPSECCMGEKPKDMATTCTDQGGICLPGADCTPGRGYFSLTDVECGAPNFGCCIPHAVCGDMPFDCCGSGAGSAYHPALCDHGTLACEDGFSKRLLGACSHH